MGAVWIVILIILGIIVGAVIIIIGRKIYIYYSSPPQRNNIENQPISAETEPLNPQGPNEATYENITVDLGIPNIGNTCYFNSITQIFKQIPKFRNIVKSSDSDIYKSLASILDILISKRPQNKLKPLVVNFLKHLEQHHPMFAPNAQNDCKELYNILVDRLFEELPNEINFFSTKTKQRFTCEKGHETTKDQSQLFLIIPLNDKLDSEKCINDIKTKENTFELYCESCGELTSTKMITESLDLPEYMVFYVADTTHQDRDPKTNIKYGDKEYELFGVICYYGSGKSGHYIAFALNERKWIKYNDAFVDENDPDYDYAYMLFYKQKI